MDLWKEDQSNFVRLGKSGTDYYSRVCCSGRNPILGKSLVVSIYGAPPYVTVDPAARKIGGIELDLVSKGRIRIMGSRLGACVINDPDIVIIASIATFQKRGLKSPPLILLEINSHSLF